MTNKGPLTPLSDEELYFARENQRLIDEARASGKPLPGLNGGQSPQPKPSSRAPQTDAGQNTSGVWILAIGLIALVIALATVWANT